MLYIFMHEFNFFQSKACIACSRVFPNQSFSSGINTPADVSVMRLSEMVLNDVPVADPRWRDTSSSQFHTQLVHVSTCICT